MPPVLIESFYHTIPHSGLFAVWNRSKPARRGNMNIQNKPPTSSNNEAATGRRRPRRTPKGRQVDPVALEEVRSLLTDRSRRRDLLIEHLHLIQDKYGHISAA